MKNLMRSILSLVLMAALITASCRREKFELPLVLQLTVDDITAHLQAIDSIGLSMVAQMKGHVPDDSLLREIFISSISALQELEIIAATGTDSAGTVTAYIPEGHADYIGHEIGHQEHFVKMRSTREPVLSSAFKAIEGYQGMVLGYPLLDENENYSGAITLFFRPESFLEDIVQKRTVGVPADIWIMEKEGVILYDFDEEEIGRNLFTDPLYRSYTESLQTARRFIEETEGKDTYQFLSQGLEEPVINQASWTTINFRGQEWKAIMIIPEGEHDVKRSPGQYGIKSALRKLEELSSDEVFLNYLSIPDKAEVMRYFEAFYNDNAIYSIQWVDSTITSRFGYPQDKSLENFTFTEEVTSHKPFYDAVLSHEQTIFTQELFEGGIGRFYIQPIDYKGYNLGSIYFIKLEP